METEPRYERLPGGSGFFVLHRAYLADDHLLAVKTMLFVERYRRLYFRDVESLALQRCDRAFFLGAVTFLVAFFAWLGAWVCWPGFDAGSGFGWSVFWAIIAGGATVVFLVNLALGPGCICQVRTAVQTVELPSLNRWRRALRAREVLLARIAAAQGLTAGAATSDAMRAPAAIPPGMLRSAGAGAPSQPPSLDAAPAPAAVQAVGGLALGTGLAAAGVALDYVQTAGWAVIVMLLGVLAALAAMTVQLVAGRSGRLPRRSQRIALGVVGVTLAGAVGAYVSMMALIFENLATPPSQFEFMLGLWRLAPGENAVVDASYLTVAALYLVVALLAVMEWLRVDAARRAGLPVGRR